MGSDNISWELIYNPSSVNGDFWTSILKQIREINPKFIYTSPSVFMAMREFLDQPFECPVIFSFETLSDAVRKEALCFFTQTIDKMRDWTTGFGFFECKFGIKHVYDDLCSIRQDSEGGIWCLDFFNYCERVEKISDDKAKIRKDACACGIYGNIIDSFEGKIFECLISIEGTKYSANYVSNYLMALTKYGIVINNYQIVQDYDKNILFNIGNKISNYEAFALGNSISLLLFDQRSGKVAKIKNNGSIILNSNENFTIDIEHSNPKINGNKKISLRSYAS
jgi:hypothetical protein